MTSECVLAESAEEPHAAQQVAVRDSCRGDDHLLRREVVDREDTFDVVDAMRPRLFDLGSPRRPELRLQLAAEAAQRRGCEHRLARTTDPDCEVIVRTADGRADRRGHVAVLDQLDPGAGGADLLDQVVMPRPVEDDRGDVVDHAAERVGDRPDVVLDRLRERDPPARNRPTAIFRMYMSGSDGIEPRGDAAIIETAFVPPRATTARPSSGSSARSYSSPPAPIDEPAASCSASSCPPITTCPLIGICSSAIRAPENAASSAAS